MQAAVLLPLGATATERVGGSVVLACQLYLLVARWPLTLLAPRDRQGISDQRCLCAAKPGPGPADATILVICPTAPAGIIDRARYSVLLAGSCRSG
eukprot:COSAG01_NODE_337_length_18678_cov_21.905969_9_plen_96_part_00